MIEETRARRNLAINVFCKLQDMGLPYSWLASETGVYPSRIQKILEQTSTPGFSIVLNISEKLGMSVEQISANPSQRDIERYRKKYPELEKVA